MKKLKVGVIFGGKSAEHEVSLNSAKTVINALDKKKYQVISVKIPKNGVFNYALLKKVDVIFPVLHGPYGEDGSMQGLFKLLGKPFVGAGVLGSAVGLDKDVMKRLLREANIPIPRFVVLRDGEKISFEKVKRDLGLPMFIKPANLGSSVGVYKVKNENEFHKATKDAFRYDLKVIVEEFIDGKEVECAVLGNDSPVASNPGEIIPSEEFYSYNAKYVNDSETLTEARIKKATKDKVRNLAVKAYKVLGCEGMGRVDFLLDKREEVFVNEINTIPGFTSISMYPKLWEASGLSITKLLDRLIELAIERFNKEQKLKTTFK